MFAVGLTGGIASGKSTVSDLFAKRQVPVIDTDVISHRLLDPGEPAYQLLRNHFGDCIIDADGCVNRKQLRERVFSESAAKTWLEAILHPLIYRRSRDEILAFADAKYVLVVVPLLFEANFEDLVDRILVVDCPAEQQLSRLMQRDHIDEKLARSILAQQLENSARVARADDVIDNSDAGMNLDNQVTELHRQYLQQALSY